MRCKLHSQPVGEKQEGAGGGAQEGEQLKPTALKVQIHSQTCLGCWGTGEARGWVEEGGWVGITSGATQSKCKFHSQTCGG